MGGTIKSNQFELPIYQKCNLLWKNIPNRRRFWQNGNSYFIVEWTREKENQEQQFLERLDKQKLRGESNSKTPYCNKRFEFGRKKKPKKSFKRYK